MKKLNFLIAFLFFLSPYAESNFYAPAINLIMCDSRENCYHEAAHKYDHLMGDISKTQEWQQAVEEYRSTAFYGYTDAKDVPVETIKLVFFPGIGREKIPDFNPFNNSFGGWGNYTEFYATVSEYSNGDINNIPENLRKFYDMNEIGKIVKGLGY